MVIYLDSSALLKRAITEEHSQALREAISGYVAEGEILCSSTLAWVEVGRALRSRHESADPVHITKLFGDALMHIKEAPMSSEVTSVAQRIASPVIRSLDALHLASASIVDADLVVAYDRRLLEVAAELGFQTSSPGAPEND